MNQPGQPQGPGGQQQDPTARLIKVQHVKSLANIPENVKAKWISAIDNFSSIVSSNPRESVPYRNAMTQWMQLTQTAVQANKAAQAKKAAAQQASNQGSQSGQNLQQNQQQQLAQNQQQQQQHVQQQQQQTPQMNQSQMNQAMGQQGQPQQQGQRPQLPPVIAKHVNETIFYHPNGAAPGTPAYEQWLPATKEKYTQLVYTTEMHKSSLGKLHAKQKEMGQESPPALQAEIKKHIDAYTKAKTDLDKFRTSQNQIKEKYGSGNMQQQGQQQDGDVSAPGSATIPQQPFQLKLPGQPNQPTQGTNPAVEAARNAAANRTSMSPTTAGGQQQPPQMGQAPTSFAPPQQPGNNGMAQQQHPSSATQQHRPSLSTQQPMNNGMPHQNSPHNAQGNPAGGPISLSHQQAMSNAQRAYSQQQTPQSAAPSSLGQNNTGYGQPTQGQVPSREHGITDSSRPKVSANLPPHLYKTPPAVPFPAPRPTLAGPSNGVGGMMGQPAITKAPPFQLEGTEGGGVLSKKKLDELVRQVTGGGEGLGGESLTPEVEEAMLMLADEFVDNVITAACRLAKLRESATLDIKDLQLVLERNYHIRIPGYASDEIRAIRKSAPAPGWTHKMNAVQAAKVMGGKTDI